MHRSGLALAGAQTTIEAWKRDEVPPVENDGILTAEDVPAAKRQKSVEISRQTVWRFFWDRRSVADVGQSLSFISFLRKFKTRISV